jgi:hypothetical protein
VAKSPVIEQISKCFATQLSPSNVLVSINSRSQVFLTVIEMESFNPLEANHFIELSHGGQVLTFGRKRITSSENVTSVETHVDAIRVSYPRQDCCDLLELVPQAAPLARSGLN